MLTHMKNRAPNFKYDVYIGTVVMSDARATLRSVLCLLRLRLRVSRVVSRRVTPQ
jgi:hypothetical protein